MHKLIIDVVCFNTKFYIISTKYLFLTKLFTKNQSSCMIFGEKLHILITLCIVTKKTLFCKIYNIASTIRIIS